MTFTDELFSLEGRTAVVTGSSAGIGARLARTLVQAGAHVVGIARRTTELDEQTMASGRLVPLTADLSEREQVEAAARDCLDILGGRVDVLVNNAGYIAAGVKAEDETAEDVRRTLAVNLEAPIVLAQSFVPGMRDAGNGSIALVRQSRWWRRLARATR